MSLRNPIALASAFISLSSWVIACAPAPDHQENVASYSSAAPDHPAPETPPLISAPELLVSDEELDAYLDSPVHWTLAELPPELQEVCEANRNTFSDPNFGKSCDASSSQDAAWYNRAIPVRILDVRLKEDKRVHWILHLLWDPTTQLPVGLALKDLQSIVLQQQEIDRDRADWMNHIQIHGHPPSRSLMRPYQTFEAAYVHSLDELSRHDGPALGSVVYRNEEKEKDLIWAYSRGMNQEGGNIRITFAMNLVSSNLRAHNLTLQRISRNETGPGEWQILAKVETPAGSKVVPIHELVFSTNTSIIGPVGLNPAETTLVDPKSGKRSLHPVSDINGNR